MHVCDASSEFVSSGIPSWQIVTAHAQSFRGARDLAFCLKFPLDSLLVWASSGGSGKTARMRRLAWTFAARIGDKYQIRLTRPILCMYVMRMGCICLTHLLNGLVHPYHLDGSISNFWGARWLSGRVSDSGARGPGFETYRRRVVSLSKTLYSPKVLVNYPGSDGSVPTWLKNCWLGR